MADLDVLGVGIWSPHYGNWAQYVAGLRGEAFEPLPLQPGRIPPRERRRAPQIVKAAIEVMEQACQMANVPAEELACVFSSSMGDMQITDYMCDILNRQPEAVSPTRFHNSVHNATNGYWSIAAQSHQAGSAVSAFEHTAPMAVLEAAVQAYEEKIPVLVVVEEIAAPVSLYSACPSLAPFAAALLIAPVASSVKSCARLSFKVESGRPDWPEQSPEIPVDLKGNRAATMLPIFRFIADARATDCLSLAYPLSQALGLHLSLLRHE